MKIKIKSKSHPSGAYYDTATCMAYLEKYDLFHYQVVVSVGREKLVSSMVPNLSVPYLTTLVSRINGFFYLCNDGLIRSHEFTLDLNKIYYLVKYPMVYNDKFY